MALSHQIYLVNSQLVSLTHLILSFSGFFYLIPYEINLLSDLASIDLTSTFHENILFEDMSSQDFQNIIINFLAFENLVELK